MSILLPLACRQVELNSPSLDRGLPLTTSSQRVVCGEGRKYLGDGQAWQTLRQPGGQVHTDRGKSRRQHVASMRGGDGGAGTSLLFS